MAKLIHHHADTQQTHREKPLKPAVEHAPVRASETAVSLAARARMGSRTLTPHHMVALQRAMGNRVVERLIQAKLTVNAPDDPYEQEADKFAARVLTMHDPAHRQVENEGPEDELQEKPMTQRRSDGGFETDDAFTGRLRATQGAGRPLPAATREFMESCFAADFSGVRVHTGSEAVELSREVQAQAFTYGNDIYFNEGKYDPASRDGRQLLAHELTHTIQQTGGIERKVEFNFSGKVGLKARLEGGHNAIFNEILETFKEYQKDKDINAERGHLKTIMELCKSYIDYVGKNRPQDTKSKKYEDAQKLLVACQKELIQKISEIYIDYEEHKDEDASMDVSRLCNIVDLCSTYISHVGSTGRGEYLDHVKKLERTCRQELPHAEYMRDMEQGTFQYLTTTGRTATTIGKPQTLFAGKHGLSVAELIAIRVYTAGDYQYMNPVVAGNDPWLLTTINQLISPREKIGSEGTITYPAEWTAPWAKEMLTTGVFSFRLTGIRLEAARHNRMAESGLRKLPDVKATTYRGEGWSKTDFEKRYQVGHEFIFPIFASTSLDLERSKSFARDNVSGTKIGALLIMKVTKGKDVAEIALTKSEKEILLPPYSVFRVNKITPPTPADAFYKVEMEQTQ